MPNIFKSKSVVPMNDLPPPPRRELTEQEVRAFGMLATWEDLVDNRRIYGTLEMSPLAVDTIQKHDIAKPLKIMTAPASGTRRVVRFDLVELGRYLHYVCKCVGFTVSIHGEVTTRDGIKLMIPFTTQPLQLTRK